MSCFRKQNMYHLFVCLSVPVLSEKQWKLIYVDLISLCNEVDDQGCLYRMCDHFKHVPSKHWRLKVG